MTRDSEITFEYRLKKVKELLAIKEINFETMTEFPFQVQITYKALNGAKCVRVITNSLQISNDKHELNQNADYEVLGINAVQQTSKMAKQGNIREA